MQTSPLTLCLFCILVLCLASNTALPTRYGNYWYTKLFEDSAKKNALSNDDDNYGDWAGDQSGLLSKRDMPDYLNFQLGK